MTRIEKMELLNVLLELEEKNDIGNLTSSDRAEFQMWVKGALVQEPKQGHWIEEFNDIEGEVRFTCSCCGKYQLFGTDYCYHCGSKNE